MSPEDNVSPEDTVGVLKEGQTQQPDGSLKAVSVRQTLREVSHALENAGVPSPRVDAELLVASALGVTRGRLPLIDDIDDASRQQLQSMVERRLKREPLQYVVGVAPFLAPELEVGPGVFIPRPETELLAMWGIKQLTNPALPTSRQAADLTASDGHSDVDQVSSTPLVFDLCSGSGAVAITISQAVSASRVWAVERSADALTYLKRNIARHAPTVKIVHADVTSPLSASHNHQAYNSPVEAYGLPVDDMTMGEGSIDKHFAVDRVFGEDELSSVIGQVDLILANPPYVPDGASLIPEVSSYEPSEAIFGGSDGLDVIRGIVINATLWLRPGGQIGIEHDDEGGSGVAKLFSEVGFDKIRAHTDLAGKQRFTTATWH